MPHSLLYSQLYSPFANLGDQLGGFRNALEAFGAPQGGSSSAGQPGAPFGGIFGPGPRNGTKDLSAFQQHLLAAASSASLDSNKEGRAPSAASSLCCDDNDDNNSRRPKSDGEVDVDSDASSSHSTASLVKKRRRRGSSGEDNDGELLGEGNEDSATSFDSPAAKRPFHQGSASDLSNQGSGSVWRPY
jgi:hypothetical protein